MIALGRHEADAGNAAQGIDVGGDAVRGSRGDVEGEEEAQTEIVEEQQIHVAALLRMTTEECAWAAMLRLARRISPRRAARL